jgi:hypothetical protein
MNLSFVKFVKEESNGGRKLGFFWEIGIDCCSDKFSNGLAVYTLCRSIIVNYLVHEKPKIVVSEIACLIYF